MRERAGQRLVPTYTKEPHRKNWAERTRSAGKWERVTWKPAGACQAGGGFSPKTLAVRLSQDKGTENGRGTRARSHI